MRRGIHELSDLEKWRLADEPTMPIAPFGALVAAALLFLAFLVGQVPTLLGAPGGIVPATHLTARLAAGPGS